MTFYDKYVYLCSMNGKSPSATALEMGFNKSAVSNWKRGRNNPSDVTLAKVAKHFNVPVSFLSNDSDDLSPVLYITAKDNNLNSAVKLLEHQMGMVAEENKEVATVGREDPRVKKLAPFISQMTDAEVEKVLGFIQGTIAARK